VSLYKPKKSTYWHYDFTIAGQRYHGTTRCPSKRDAQRVEADLRRKAVLGETVTPTISLEQACSDWQANVGSHLASKATTLYQLGFLIAGIGGMLQDITHKAVQDYAARRRATVKNASVNRELQLLRRVIRWTEPRGFEVPKLDFAKLTLPEPKERVRELSADEEARLMAVLPDNLKPIVQFALLSGKRRTEIITLRWADIDLAGQRATVTVKGGHRQTFPLSPKMLAIIKAQPKVCPQVFTYLCQRRAPDRKDRPGRIVGERYPFSKQGWVRQWRKALSDAGIEDYRFHDNRHTAATRNLRSSGNLKAVSKMLGHENVQTTAKYAHALEDDVRAMMLATETGQASTQTERAKSA